MSWVPDSSIILWLQAILNPGSAAFWIYFCGLINFSPLQDYQVDWEAILARSPNPFIQSVSPWLYPPAAREALLHAPSGQGLTADSARIEPGLPATSESPITPSSHEGVVHDNVHSTADISSALDGNEETYVAVNQPNGDIQGMDVVLC